MRLRFSTAELFMLIACGLAAGVVVGGLGRVACTPAKSAPRPAALLATALGTITPIPRTHWVAECSELPADAATGLEVLAVVRRPGRVGVLLRAGDKRGWLVGHRLGSREAGWHVYAVTGPAAMVARMSASPSCRVVLYWNEAWATLPAAARQWLAERSTCCGEMVHRGRTFRAWPCSWETERAGEVNVVSRSGIGPGVTPGGDGCALVGLGGG